MVDLSFTVEGAEALPFAVDPQLAMHVRVENRTPGTRVHGALLRCQVQVAVDQRAYAPAEEERLADSFGPRNRWGTTMKSLLWTVVGLNVPAFDDHVRVDLLLPCSFDFDLGITKVLSALREGVIPLRLLMSGMVFFAAPDTPVRAAPIPWSQETKYRLPLTVWQNVRDAHYPERAVLSVRRDLFDRLAGYKSRWGLATLDQTLERLLATETKGTP